MARAPLTLAVPPPEQPPLPPPVDVLVAADEGAEPKIDPATGVLTIEHDDGTVTIDFNPQPEREKKNDDFYANLAEDITEGELARIADTLIRGIEADNQSRAEWLATRAKGMALLGLELKEPRGDVGTSSAPLDGMSQVQHPLLLEATLRFQSNAGAELLPAAGPVKVRNDGDETGQTDELADQLERDMNHYLTAVCKEYYPDTDRMLFWVGFGGCAFKKVYSDPIKRRPVSESVDAKDIIVSNAASDIASAGRWTHQIQMRPSTLKRMQMVGAYRDVPLMTPAPPDPNPVDRKIGEIQGIDPNAQLPEDRDRTIYECYCELDIVGFEHEEGGKLTGLLLPYKVTLDKDSRQVLEVRRNWREEDELCLPIMCLVKYPFVPAMGFYDIGLVHILGNTTSALTAAWREMLDAGMFANFPGFLFAKGLGRQLSNEFRVGPGSGVPIDTSSVIGGKIGDAVMPLPYKDVGSGLMSLTDNIAQTGQRVGGTAELQVGEGRQDAPVGTTLALIEQATKVMAAVHKRLHAAQSEEFQLLRDRLREDPEAFWRHRRDQSTWSKENLLKALDDFDLVPAADPNTPSHVHRIMKAVAVKQLQALNPQLYDAREVDERVLRMLGWQDPESMFAPPQQPAQPTLTPDKQADIALKAAELHGKQLIEAMKLKGAEEKQRTDKELKVMEIAKDLAIHEPAGVPIERTLADAPKWPRPL